jgi:hypothetical protein
MTVTLKPGGIVEGAVKVAGAPLAVLEGLKKPQGTIVGPQVADHVTPLFELSPVTTTAIGAEVLTWMAFGGAALELKASVMLGVVRVMLAETDLVLSATEVAVTVTELLVAEGRAEGAVYVVEVAGPVVVNEPHAVPLAEQVTDHLTPALVESLVRVTASEAVALTWRVAITTDLKEMETGGVGVVLIEEEPPHATSTAPMPMTVNNKMPRLTNIVASIN